MYAFTSQEYRGIVCQKFRRSVLATLSYGRKPSGYFFETYGSLLSLYKRFKQFKWLTISVSLISLAVMTKPETTRSSHKIKTRRKNYLKTVSR